MNPYLAASLAVLEEMYDDLAGADHATRHRCPNWTPLVAETNSIAVLTVHTAGSVNSWLARALQEPFERDRDAEFLARRSASDFLVLLDYSRHLAREQFARLDAVDGGDVHTVRRLSSGQDAEVSVAWCVEHAIIHAGSTGDRFNSTCNSTPVRVCSLLDEREEENCVDQRRPVIISVMQYEDALKAGTMVTRDVIAAAARLGADGASRSARVLARQAAANCRRRRR